MDTMPGDAEAHAAVAYLHEQTPSGWPFEPGMTVRCPRAFGNGIQTGLVVCRELDRRIGTVYLVDTPEGRLKLLPDELEVVA